MGLKSKERAGQDMAMDMCSLFLRLQGSRIEEIKNHMIRFYKLYHSDVAIDETFVCGKLSELCDVLESSTIPTQCAIALLATEMMQREGYILTSITKTIEELELSEEDFNYAFMLMDRRISSGYPHKVPLAKLSLFFFNLKSDVIRINI